MKTMDIYKDFLKIVAYVYGFIYVVFALYKGSPFPHLWGGTENGWVILSGIVSFFAILIYSIRRAGESK